MISSEVADGGAPRPVPIRHSLQRVDVFDSRAHWQRRGPAEQVARHGADGRLRLVARAGHRRGEADAARARDNASFAALLQARRAAARRVRRAGGRESARAARRGRHPPFRLAPIAAPTDDAPCASAWRSTTRRRRCRRPRSTAPVAKFSVDEVLEPHVVRPFLDFLQREHPVSAAQCRRSCSRPARATTCRSPADGNTGEVTK